MGVSSDWTKLWQSEDENEFAKKDKMPPNVRAVFIDAQIRLMKSFVKEGCSWKSFVEYMFLAYIEKKHQTCDVVVLAFDNYGSVPLYKSIEQLRRTNSTQKKYKFETGQELPPKPPAQETWTYALQNRVFKTTVISIICNLIATNYKPRTNGKTLIIDYINVIRIDYSMQNGVLTPQRETLSDLQAMGESDVKFMRYADIVGSMVVDSVDSDVMLIAMLFIQKHTQHDIYVRRYKPKIKDEDNTKKRPREQPAKEYEVIDIKKFRDTMHACVYEAIGRDVIVQGDTLTLVLTFIFLMAGSDFTRKLPRVGAKTLWDMLHVIVPLTLLCVHRDSDGVENIDADKFVDIVVSNIYRDNFAKHVKTDEDDYDLVYKDLIQSKLADKTKADLLTRDALVCTLKNIQWVVEYWQHTNSPPPIDTSGLHGFVMRDGLLRYAA